MQKSQLDTLATQEKYNTLHDCGALFPSNLFLSLSSVRGLLIACANKESGDVAISGRHLATRKRDVF